MVNFSGLENLIRLLELEEDSRKIKTLFEEVVPDKSSLTSCISRFREDLQNPKFVDGSLQLVLYLFQKPRFI